MAEKKGAVMSQLSHADYAAVLEAVREIHAHGNLQTFPYRIMRVLAKLVAADSMAYEELNPALNQMIGFCIPDEARPMKLLKMFQEVYLPTHPTFQGYVRQKVIEPRSLADYLPRSQFVNSGLYKDYYKPAGVEDQLAVYLPAPDPILIAVAFNRTRWRFSEREKAMLDLVKPHLMQAYWNSKIVTDLANSKVAAGSMKAGNLGLLSVGEKCEIRWCTTFASIALAECFPDWKRNPAKLPEKLAAFVRAHRAALAGNPDELAHTLRVPGADGRNVAMQFIRGPATAEYLIAIKREYSEPAEVTVNLSPRQAQVLDRLLAGQSVKQIASALSLRLLTVQTYVRDLYRRMGVSGRGELMAKFVRR